MRVYASIQAWVWVCVYMSSSTKSPVDSYLCVYVMKPGSAKKKRAMRCMCVCMRLRVSAGDYMRVSAICTL